MINHIPSKLNKQKSLIPLYVRIESVIRHKILNGHFEPGKRLPNEEALVKQYGASRITIRNALAQLQQEGLIERNRAKGTFVSAHIPAIEKFVITNEFQKMLTTQLFETGRYFVTNISIETTSVGNTRQPRVIRNFFNLDDDSKIAVVHRTGLLKEEPLFFLENFLLPEIARHINPEELSSKPLLSCLKEKLGLALGRGEMFIEAVPAEPEIAELLNIPIFEPLILRELYYHLKSGDPYEVAFCYMRPDYFKYRVDLMGTDLDSKD
jgi:GntR family transcriptional regulator